MNKKDINIYLPASTPGAYPVSVVNFDKTFSFFILGRNLLNWHNLFFLKLFLNVVFYQICVKATMLLISVPKIVNLGGR